MSNSLPQKEQLTKEDINQLITELEDIDRRYGKFEEGKIGRERVRLLLMEKIKEKV